MERNYDELHAVCESLNAEEQEAYEKICLRIEVLEKRRNVCRWIKIISIPLCIFFIGIISYWIAKKISENAIQEINSLNSSVRWNYEYYGKQYVEKVYHKLVGLSVTDGSYDKKMIKKELSEAKLMLPQLVEYKGGLSGVFDNITFVENHVVMSKLKMNKTEKIIFDGTIIQFENPKPCYKPVYVRNILNSIGTEDYVEGITVDNIDFRNDIFVNSMDKMSAFKVLTPKYMEKLYPYIKNRGIISQIVYGSDKILVFVPERFVNYQYTPTHPFTLEQCEENIKETNEKLKNLVSEIYEIVVENMR